MNAVAAIVPAPAGGKPLGQVINWRGKCMGHFARVEWSITCLLLLKNPSEQKRLPHLAGAKSAALRELLGEAGKSDAVAKQCVSLLELWADLERERDWIAHGNFSFAVADDGWVLIAEMLVLANGRPRRTAPSIRVAELKPFEKHLETVSASVCEALDAAILAIAGSWDKARQLLYNASSRAP